MMFLESASAVAAELTATPATTTAACPIFLRLGFVHGQGATVVLLPVQGRNGGLSFGIAAHLDKAKALASAGVAIVDDLRALDSAMRAEELFECRAIDIVA